MSCTLPLMHGLVLFTKAPSTLAALKSSRPLVRMMASLQSASRIYTSGSLHQIYQASGVRAASCQSSVKVAKPFRTGLSGLSASCSGINHTTQLRLPGTPLQKQYCHKSFSTRAAASSVEVGGASIPREDVVREDDPDNNVSDSIFSKLGLQLHRRDDHPLGIIKNAIYEYFDKAYDGQYKKFDDLVPIVSTKANFDDVLVPEDHVSRSTNDTYYVNKETVLRCHTSAHQAELLKQGNTHFLVTGDVYRRDSIDATHYPVFHQMEGFRVFSAEEWEAAGVDGTTLAANDLKATLEGLTKHLFGDVEMRWVDAYFPFTEPSYELEIFFQGEWLEVLGCGVTHQQIMRNCGVEEKRAWAFGLGLERLAMVLFEIPDIRLFWSSDKRFTSQFKKGQLGLKFKSYSKYPPCYKDISFWINNEFTENNLCEIVRGIAGDLAEEVKLIDNFTNKKGMTSHCYRIAYRSMERSLTDEEVNDMQAKVRQAVGGKLKVSLR